MPSGRQDRPSSARPFHRQQGKKFLLQRAVGGKHFIAFEHPGAAARVLSEIIERGARVQGPAVRAYIERLRDGSPDATPAEIITKLEKQYLAAVMASGAAVGSAAAIPGIGTLAALSAVAGETVVFLEATALFVLAVAEVHGIPVEHRERRRALVLSVLVGEDSKHAVADLLGPGRTKLLFYSGRLFSARRALELGLVDDVFPDERLEAETYALAEEIAANAPLSVRNTKRVLGRLTSRPLSREALAEIDQLLRETQGSADFQEGQRAFFEKRRPTFKGR